MGDVGRERALFMFGAERRPWPHRSRELFVDPQPTRVSRATGLRLPFTSPPSTIMRCSHSCDAQMEN